MNNKHQLALMGFFLALGFVISTYIFCNALIKVVPSNQVVKVRGISERVIKSDLVNWNMDVFKTKKVSKDAFRIVENQVGTIVQFLKSKGIDEKYIQLSDYRKNKIVRKKNTDKLKNYIYVTEGYKITRKISIIGFNDLDLIEKISKSFTKEMEDRNIETYQYNPYFYFSENMLHIKPELLKEAAKDAYTRATIVAESSGSKLGPLKAARQGSFRGFNSDGTVGGNSREHRVSALVTVDYALK